MVHGPQIHVLNIGIVVCTPPLLGAAKYKIDMARNVAGSFTPDGRLIRLTPVVPGVEATVLAFTPDLVHLCHQACPVTDRLAQPEALLLDEPFSSLDDSRRTQIVNLVQREAKRLNLPVLLVSHDPRDVDAATNNVVQLTPE